MRACVRARACVSCARVRACVRVCVCVCVCVMLKGAGIGVEINIGLYLANISGHLRAANERTENLLSDPLRSERGKGWGRVVGMERERASKRGAGEKGWLLHYDKIEC